jgi:hypothetical protein
MQTVPYLIDNPEVGYVQVRWVFANPDESYLTKAQEISLNFHCKCEQFVHFASGSFFNFNGTAGALTVKIHQVLERISQQAARRQGGGGAFPNHPFPICAANHSLNV